MFEQTPAKSVRSHSDVEPDTPSPSITHQPKSSRLGLGLSSRSDSSDLLYTGQTIATKDILEMIKDEMRGNFRLILKEEIATGNDSLLSKLEVLKNRIEAQNKEIEWCKEELNKERQLRKVLEEKLLGQETYSRRDNLLFSGIAEERGETYQDCERKVIQALSHAGLGNLNPGAVVRAHRIGRPQIKPGERPRPILMRFLLFKDRQFTFENRSALRQNHIFVNEDFPEEVTKRRQVLTPLYWAIHKYTTDGKQFPYRHSVKLVGDKLIFNGQLYTTETVHKLPQMFQPEAVSSPSKDGTTAFFTSSSPLSNHFKSYFQVGSKNYNCVEQYFMSEKALLFKDDESAARIMASVDPKEHKWLGKTVKGLKKDVWESNRDRIMKIALEAKFEQSDICTAFLKGTKKTRLVEANPNDRYWAVGLGLRDKDIWHHNKWKGQNKLGEMLMEVRETL